jgi:hypothetical protein
VPGLWRDDDAMGGRFARVVERRRATKKCKPINFIAVLGVKAKLTQPPDFEIRHRSRVAE